MSSASDQLKQVGFKRKKEVKESICHSNLRRNPVLPELMFKVFIKDGRGTVFAKVKMDSLGGET